jgi:hypothetical protein
MCCPAYLMLSLLWLMESCRVMGLQQKPPLTPWSHPWWLQGVGGGSRQGEGEGKSKVEGKGEGKGKGEGEVV